MAIYELLHDIKDERSLEGRCSFNGYLEDYLTIIEGNDQIKEAAFFQALLEKDADLRICVKLKLNINKAAIANQIIRYKDAFKLPKGTIYCPYIIYGKFQQAQKAMILVCGDKESYVIAKALYYVISEPDNEYEGTRNEMIACNIDNQCLDIVNKAAERFFWQNEKAGIVQRSLDAQLFSGFHEMYELSSALGKRIQNDVKQILKDSTDYELTVNEMIATWFLLKKFVYVQYMMDKTHLKNHDGNVKLQRQYAKEKCDSIGFISYSELWRSVKEIKQN